MCYSEYSNQISPKSAAIAALFVFLRRFAGASEPAAEIEALTRAYEPRAEILSSSNVSRAMRSRPGDLDLVLSWGHFVYL